MPRFLSSRERVLREGPEITLAVCTRDRPDDLVLLLRDRQSTYATLYHGTDNAQIVHQIAVDLTRWHTLGVEWTPAKLVYTLDGRDWATVRSADVPAVPMALDLQTQAFACGTSSWERCPSALTPSDVNMYVD
jgi:hypothetical protein